MYIYVLVVLVVADARWLDWNQYARQEECEEVIRIITHHREDTVRAQCELRWIELSKLPERGPAQK